jgi:hypothetical protein
MPHSFGRPSFSSLMMQQRDSWRGIGLARTVRRAVMSIRIGRLLTLAMVGLAWLCGCSTATKISGLPTADGDGPSSADPTKGDATGSIITPPAEPGPYGEAVAPLSKPGLMGDDPDDDLQLGKKYFRSNNFGLAEKSFRIAAEKHPRDAEAWVGLAVSYDRLHRFDLADRAYAEAVRIVGPTVEILNDEGFSYMLRGDYGRAHKLLEEAQSKGPNNPYVQANIELLQGSYRSGKTIQ